jgi:diguanylate cyclase (GGDEF)-like protein
MFRDRLAPSPRPAGRTFIPASVRVRATLAMIAVLLPIVILLIANLYSEYSAAKVLRSDGDTVLLNATENRIAVTAILATLWVAVVLLATIRIVEDRVLRPLRHLTGVASRLAEGELDSRVDVNRIQMIDMRRLAATVNGMAEILEKLALTDSLTAVANRRQFDAVIAGEVKRSMRMKKGLALLLIDVDKFKDYNDLYGHGAGDLCLKRIAAALQGAIRRPSDLVARYGGEEFVVLLPDTDAPGAHAVAADLLAAVRGLEIAHSAWERQIVTISIGLAVSPPQPVIDAARLIERADQALYAAKQAGRDRALMNETMTFAA